jgi:hypothetical protein
MLHHLSTTRVVYKAQAMDVEVLEGTVPQPTRVDVDVFKHQERIA